jgi:26S proteasome regulatory subunit T4
MDGFDSLGKTKLIMATNRPDTLDPALLRPGRLDRKIEIPLPNEQGRLEILKIHAKGINKSGDIDYEAVVKLSDGFNGADLRNVCTEAGMFAIREDRYVCPGRRRRLLSHPAARPSPLQAVRSSPF